MDHVRLDKWLWAARVFKTRSLAGQACDGGKVDVNGQAARPAKAVRAGDRVEVTLTHGRRILQVRALGDRRGPAAAASQLYEDLTPPPPPRDLRARPGVYRAPGAGRPTKRERRRLERLLGPG